MWLSEIEGQLISDDYGKDLTSVQNLQKKHALLEADVGAHQDRVDGVRISSPLSDGIVQDWDAAAAILEHTFKACLGCTPSGAVCRAGDWP